MRISTRILALLPVLGSALWCASAAPPQNATESPSPRTSPNSPARNESAAPAASSYWLANIKRQGVSAFNPDANYKVFRNVKDFGAKGDGATDDTEAINKAIYDGSRCGKGCDSQTTTPALVYFPPGTYIVSKPIIQYYYTQLVGDVNQVPVLKAAPGFVGMAVIDADPYDDKGQNWYTNQNNFYRQIRNFVIDLRAMPLSAGAGIHWQIAQATSLQNIVFEMIRDKSDANKQQGIFMDNGSGGFMTDLVFNGGKYGAFLGNQQFTTRNLTFNDCQTAIFMNWNWAWTFKSLTINNCDVGVDLSNTNDQGELLVGSVLLLDSTIKNTAVGIKTARTDTSKPASAGTLIIDNVDFTGTPQAVVNKAGNVLAAGNAVIPTWAHGRAYSGTSAAGSLVQKPVKYSAKPKALLDAKGRVFERSKPQYGNVPVTSFLSAKDNGCKGDGKTDDTAAIQRLFNRAGPNDIVYFDHGAYIISNTINVPANLKVTGEIWPVLLAKGQAFQDEAKPIPVFRVGKAGQRGNVEMSDLIITTAGAQPGAILMEWNLHGAKQGSAGLWDVHFRIGGFAGTELQSDKCLKNPSKIAPPNLECRASFLAFHITQQASVYLENTWFWVADHELDLPGYGQINIYNGRGVLSESAQGPVWMWGTSSEHHQLYNYQITNSKNVFMGLIQTETPYMQSNPDALVPFKPNPKYHDPTFSNCNGNKLCLKAWGLRITNSQYVFLYGGGLYSFFENYSQQCLKTESCQDHMISVEQSPHVVLLGVSTKASTSMIDVNGAPVVPQKDNRNVFCSTVALYTSDRTRKQ